AKSNQRFTVVEAESKEEAKEKYEARNKPVDGATNLNDIKSNIGIFHVEKVGPIKFISSLIRSKEGR
ncbi:DUF1381 domain-containing protein, partial [Staphylococcus aureus]